MTDIYSPKKRSLIMSKVRSMDTKPELFVRKLIFRAGYRYRLYSASLPGKPDIVLKKFRTVIFVNGCFWHGHAGCPRATTPSDNKQFWESKIAGNIVRDERERQALVQSGWRILIVWECACLKSKSNQLLRLIEDFLHSENPSAQIGKSDLMTTA